MRNELEPLLGKPVMVAGHLASQRHSGGYLWALCSKAKVYPWSRHKTMRQIKRQRYIQTDHLWTRSPICDDIKIEPGAMFKHFYCFGHIQPYTRRDGSEDLGLDWVRAATPDFGHGIWDMRREKAWIPLLHRIQEAIDSQAILFMADDKKSAAETEALLMTFKREAERMIDIALPKSDVLRGLPFL
jgi:hypothetical protein